MPPQLATAAAATAAADCLGHCGNIANATVEIKLINTTIGTDHGSGPDPGTEQSRAGAGAATTVHSHGADNGDGNRK